MFCGLNWEDNVASGQGLFRDGFRSKLACTGAAKELSGTLVRGWAQNCSPRVRNCMGFHAIA